MLRNFRRLYSQGQTIHLNDIISKKEFDFVLTKDFYQVFVGVLI
jgi:hypothetical protein